MRIRGLEVIPSRPRSVETVEWFTYRAQEQRKGYGTIRAVGTTCQRQASEKAWVAVSEASVPNVGLR